MFRKSKRCALGRDAVPVETLAPVVRPETAAVQGRERSHWFAFWGRSGCWWRLLLPQTVPATPQPRRRLHKDSTLVLSSQLDFSELLCSVGCAGSGSSGRLVSLGPVKHLPSDCIGPVLPEAQQVLGQCRDQGHERAQRSDGSPRWTEGGDCR